MPPLKAICSRWEWALTRTEMTPAGGSRSRLALVILLAPSRLALASIALASIALASPALANQVTLTPGPAALGDEERVLVEAAQYREELQRYDEGQRRLALLEPNPARGEGPTLEVVIDGPPTPGRTARLRAIVRTPTPIAYVAVRFSFPTDVEVRRGGDWHGVLPAGGRQFEATVNVPRDPYRRQAEVTVATGGSRRYGDPPARLLRRYVELNPDGLPRAVRECRDCDEDRGRLELTASAPLRPGATVDLRLRTNLGSFGRSCELAFLLPRGTVLLDGATYRPPDQATEPSKSFELTARVRLPQSPDVYLVTGWRSVDSPPQRFRGLDGVALPLDAPSPPAVARLRTARTSAGPLPDDPALTTCAPDRVTFEPSVEPLVLNVWGSARCSGDGRRVRLRLNVGVTRPFRIDGRLLKIPRRVKEPLDVLLPCEVRIVSGSVPAFLDAERGKLQVVELDVEQPADGRERTVYLGIGGHLTTIELRPPSGELVEPCSGCPCPAAPRLGLSLGTPTGGSNEVDAILRFASPPAGARVLLVARPEPSSSRPRGVNAGSAAIGAIIASASGDDLELPVHLNVADSIEAIAIVSWPPNTGRVPEVHVIRSRGDEP